MKRFWVFGVCFAATLGVAGVHAAHPNWIGVQFRLFPALIFLALGSLSVLALQGKRNASIIFCLMLLGLASLIYSLVRQELVLIYFPSLFCLPPLFWFAHFAKQAQNTSTSSLLSTYDTKAIRKRWFER